MKFALGEINFEGNLNEYVDEWSEIIKRGYINDMMLGISGEQVIPDFINGKTAMFYGGPWQYQQLKDSGLNFGMFSHVGKNKDERWLVGGPAANFGINKNSKNIEGAKAALSLLASEEVQQTILDSNPGGFSFTNNTNFDIYTQVGDIGIYTTFPDQYDSADICMTQRCHAHIWCGEESSYVMGLRMGGEPVHLGLILREGAIRDYSIERDFSHSSNHRGSIILHPSPFILPPGETHKIEWDLFWHEGRENFYQQIRSIPHYIHVESDKYVLFQGEETSIVISHLQTKLDSVEITRNKVPVPYTIEDKRIVIKEVLGSVGEFRYDIRLNGMHTICTLIVLPPLEQLVKTRCEFIVHHQQCHRAESRLDGAYLIYDNEDNAMYYSHNHDHNGGRERFGMGVVIAKYLQLHHSEELESSLQKYIAYVERELFDKESGNVYNDVGRNNDIHRLYNYSWLAVLYMELYRLYHDPSYLISMSRILHAYYDHGGNSFYPIEFPIYEMISVLRENGMEVEADSLYKLFQEHAERILALGTSYPPSEVNYEQSIVAPAANILIQMYKLSLDEKFLSAFREHLKILELFNGSQPDYNLYEVSIRHWDGFWFGKSRLFGDTFPHYWSGLTGRVFKEYSDATGDDYYRRRADASFRAVLTLIKADGRASCARIYPFKVNDTPGKFDDPWANDQDWALYFSLI